MGGASPPGGTRPYETPRVRRLKRSDFSDVIFRSSSCMRRPRISSHQRHRLFQAGKFGLHSPRPASPAPTDFHCQLTLSFSRPHHLPSSTRAKISICGPPCAPCVYRIGSCQRWAVLYATLRTLERAPSAWVARDRNAMTDRALRVTPIQVHL